MSDAELAMARAASPPRLRAQYKSKRAKYIPVTDKEWKAYDKLVEFITHCHSDSSVTPVYYHEVRRIAEVVKMPDNWRFYTPISDESPRRDRVYHFAKLVRHSALLEHIRARLERHLRPYEGYEISLESLLTLTGNLTVDITCQVMSHNADLARRIGEVNDTIPRVRSIFDSNANVNQRRPFETHFAGIPWYEIRHVVSELGGELPLGLPLLTYNLLSGYGESHMPSCDVTIPTCPTNPDHELYTILVESHSLVTSLECSGLGLVVCGSVPRHKCPIPASEFTIPLGELLSYRIAAILAEYALALPCNEVGPILVLPYEFLGGAASLLLERLGDVTFIELFRYCQLHTNGDVNRERVRMERMCREMRNVLLNPKFELPH